MLSNLDQPSAQSLASSHHQRDGGCAFRHGRKAVLRLLPAAAVLLLAGAQSILAQHSAVAAEDRFQQAVNYIFTGRVDPVNGPEIVDRQSCLVVVPEPKFNRYARYHLSSFKMDSARISKKYAGSQTLYELEVEGSDVVVDYLKPDKTTVDYGFRSAHIPLPGDPDQTEKALGLIFSQYCKPEKPRAPF
jgi:hypothetical protein